MKKSLFKKTRTFFNIDTQYLVNSMDIIFLLNYVIWFALKCMHIFWDVNNLFLGGWYHGTTSWI